MNLVYKRLLLLLILNGPYVLLCSEAKPILKPGISKKDSVMRSGMASIDGNRYTAININNAKFYIKDKSGKIIYTAHEELGIADFKFIDFNGDGYKDIVLDLFVADSPQQYLVLYDPKSKRFVLAGDCSSAEKVPKTKYLYTYEDCCAGRNWRSDLFYISNYKIIDVGHIKYSDGDGLFFYKINRKRKTLIKKWNVRIDGDTPVTTGPHIDFDLGHYWAKHWQMYVSVKN